MRSDNSVTQSSLKTEQPVIGHYVVKELVKASAALTATVANVFTSLLPASLAN